MRACGKYRGSSAILLLGLVSILLSIFCIDPARADGGRLLTVSGASPKEALRIGERMYREGILPSGEPMHAVVKGDIPVAGTAFTCVSCHLRSGLGSYEGNVLTPPVNGGSLFHPLKAVYKGFEVIGAPPFRPAYTDKSLTETLRSGIDPSGRRLNEIMPRYMVDDKDMAFLTFYLKSLSTHFSPGVSDATLRFATVITDDVSPEDRDAMLIPLENYIRLKNNMARTYERDPRQALMARSMLLSREAAYKRLSLSVWLLKGPTATWQSQLEEYYRKEPVFALLGGMTKGEWRPIHKFSEDNHIPCILPITDFPVISDTDWYTLYFSKGFYQEGEGAARYLGSKGEALKGGEVVEIVRDSPEGLALSRGFQETWRGLGRRTLVTVTLKEGEEFTGQELQQVLAGRKRSTLIIWDGPETLPVLEKLAASANKPEMVIVSAGYLGKAIWTMGEKARDFTYITYPFRLPQDEEKYTGMVESFMGITDVKGDALITLKKVYSTIRVLFQVLTDMNGQYYRDNLLDVVGMSKNFVGIGGVVAEETFPLYERFSFGPGQRYASKGCYIVQIEKGPHPGLVKKSDWVIH